MITSRRTLRPVRRPVQLTLPMPLDPPPIESPEPPEPPNEPIPSCCLGYKRRPPR